MVSNYAEWKRAVNVEYKKLQAVDLYLSEDGMKRYQAFKVLDCMAIFYDTATEFLEQFDSSELANNEHASLPLSALRWIAEHETKAK